MCSGLGDTLTLRRLDHDTISSCTASSAAAVVLVLDVTLSNPEPRQVDYLQLRFALNKHFCQYV
jgi:hypothetical protein